MSFAALIGYESFVEEFPEDGTFTKEYVNLPQEHWDRIVEAAEFLSDSKLGPTLVDVYDGGADSRELTYTLIAPFDNSEPPLELEISVDDVKAQIESAVSELHSSGWGHGDVGIQNLGTDGRTVYFLDPDTMYRIPPSYAQMIKDEESTYEERRLLQLRVVSEMPGWLVAWAHVGYEYEPFDQKEPHVLTRMLNSDREAWQSDWLY